MQVNSKTVAFIIALIVSLLSLLLYLIPTNREFGYIFLIHATIFVLAFVSVYYSVEYLIFKQINKIYKVLDKLKQKDSHPKEDDFKIRNNPFKRKKLFEEVYRYVTQKQAEINELKKLETFRREFLADISHELKTPIFAIQGYLYTLLDGAMNDKDVREKFLKKATKSVDGLQEMVEELLTLSKLETGELQMHIEDFDIYNLTKDVFELLENKARKKGVSLRFAEYSNNVRWVRGDSYQIKQVLKNLIENAINYNNEKGKVLVSFDIEKDNVVIAIKDDGLGIATEHLKRIFDRFYRIEKSRSKDKGGSGLGLAIVQEIVEAHNSKVLVYSIFGKGTTFAFTLKRGEPNDKFQRNY